MELLVALLVGGVAILGARSVLGAVADQADRIAEAAMLIDRAANGERLLRSLVGNLEVGTTRDATFQGDEAEARFTTWCTSASGWQERCTVRLVVLRPDPVSGKSIIAGVLPGRDTLPLIECDGVSRLQYLRDAASGGTWSNRWGTSVGAPLAIGIATEGDTIILRIGERG